MHTVFLYQLLSAQGCDSCLPWPRSVYLLLNMAMKWCWPAVVIFLHFFCCNSDCLVNTPLWSLTTLSVTMLTKPLSGCCSGSKGSMLKFSFSLHFYQLLLSLSFPWIPFVIALGRCFHIINGVQIRHHSVDSMEYSIPMTSMSLVSWWDQSFHCDHGHNACRLSLWPYLIICHWRYRYNIWCIVCSPFINWCSSVSGIASMLLA